MANIQLFPTATRVENPDAGTEYFVRSRLHESTFMNWNIPFQVRVIPAEQYSGILGQQILTSDHILVYSEDFDEFFDLSDRPVYFDKITKVNNNYWLIRAADWTFYMTREIPDHSRFGPI